MALLNKNEVDLCLGHPAMERCEIGVTFVKYEVGDGEVMYMSLGRIHSPHALRILKLKPPRTMYPFFAVLTWL